jgi:DNA-binding IclR family transcriptional regulator
MMSSSPEKPGWTFLTNYGHVLVCVARDPEARLRDIAEQVRITERAAQRIVADLVAEGYLKRSRVGRRNRYEVDPHRPLRHSVEEGSDVGSLLDAVARHRSAAARFAS